MNKSIKTTLSTAVIAALLNIIVFGNVNAGLIWRWKADLKLTTSPYEKDLKTTRSSWSRAFDNLRTYQQHLKTERLPTLAGSFFLRVALNVIDD